MNQVSEFAGRLTTGTLAECQVSTSRIYLICSRLWITERSVYLYVLRNSRLLGARAVHVGKRTIGEGLGKGTRSGQGNYQHIDEKLKNLARDGFIQIGDTDRTGTLYAVALPSEVPAVQARIEASHPLEAPEDHYRDPVLRKQLFERDGWHGAARDFRIVGRMQ